MFRDVQVTVAGIPVRCGRLWLIVTVILLAITLNSLAPEHDSFTEHVVWYAAGIGIALCFLISLLVHELAHARTARATGGRIQVITPALFGALTDRSYPPVTPRDDVLVALAGPVVNALAALLFGAIWWLTAGTWDLVASVLGLIALLNLVLATANLMPGLPFDGGRVFRAFVWYLTDDILLGTRFASVYGNFIALVGIISGLVLLSLGDTLSVWGAWTLLAFWTINREGRDSYLRLAWYEASKNITIDEAGLAHSQRVAADRTIDEAIDDVLQRVNDGPLLVAEDGVVVGIISLAQLRRVPRALWTERSIRDATLPITGLQRVPSDASLLTLVELFETTRADVVLVETRGRISGAVDQHAALARVRSRVREERVQRKRRT
jgi:Zn-dependent protease